MTAHVKRPPFPEERSDYEFWIGGVGSTAFGVLLILTSVHSTLGERLPQLKVDLLGLGLVAGGALIITGMKLVRSLKIALPYELGGCVVQALTSLAYAWVSLRLEGFSSSGLFFLLILASAVARSIRITRFISETRKPAGGAA